MRKGQILNGVHHKGKAIITKIGSTKIEIKWFLDISGNSISDSIRSHSIKEIQQEIDKGRITLGNSNDPNLLFSIRKTDVSS